MNFLHQKDLIYSLYYENKNSLRINFIRPSSVFKKSTRFLIPNLEMTKLTR